MFTPAQLGAVVHGMLPGRKRKGPRHVGEGAKRAAVRLQQHRDQQAARVAPALYAMEGKRWLIADARVERWIRKGRELDKAPGHIRAMAREVGMRK